MKTIGHIAAYTLAFVLEALNLAYWTARFLWTLAVNIGYPILIIILITLVAIRIFS